MKYLSLLLLLLLTACGSSKPAPEPQPEPEPESTDGPPGLRTLKDEPATWERVRGKDKRTLVVFTTLW